MANAITSKAEWEIRAKAGNSKYQYPWGNTNPSSQLANYGEYVCSTLPIASYPLNEWELYDMAGNVEEGSTDWYCPNSPYSTNMLAHLPNIQFKKT